MKGLPAQAHVSGTIACLFLVVMPVAWSVPASAYTGSVDTLATAGDGVRPAAGTVADAGPDASGDEGTPILLSGSAAPGGTTLPIWTDAFDSYPLGPLTPPWTDESVGGTNYAEISSVIARGGAGRSMHLFDSSFVLGTTAARDPGPPPTSVDLRFWVYAVQTSEIFTAILSTGSTSNQWQAVRAGMGPSGFFIYRVCLSGWYTSPVRYVAGLWYEIRILASTVTDTFDMFVNGALIASAVPLCTPSSSFQMVRMTTSGDWMGQFYVDDVSLGEWQPLTITRYEWDVDAAADEDGDGNFTNDADIVGASGLVTYGDSGDYVATLTVTDSAGNRSNDSCVVHVANLDPSLAATVDTPVSVTTGTRLMVAAQDAGSDDLLVGWQWTDGPSGNRTYLNGGTPDPPQSPWGTFPFSVQFVEPRTFPAPGTYEVDVVAVDDDGGLAFSFASVDVRDVPNTTLSVGVPSYTRAVVYVNDSTPITLLAQDRSGYGINRTYYRVDGGPISEYAAPFRLPMAGLHTVTYWSTDRLGGEEPGKNFDLYVDVEPPATTLTVTGPQVASGGALWITPAARLALNATDAGAGVAELRHRTWSAGAWSSWSTTPFPAAPPVSEGPFRVESDAMDNLGQRGAVSNASFQVDGTPPVSQLEVGTPRSDDWVTDATLYTLTSGDGSGVGVAEIRYRLWHAGAWGPSVPYSAPFVLSPGDGLYRIEYYAVDRLGNLEATRTASYRVDATPPEVSVQVSFSDSEYAFIVAIEATDSESGVARVEYRVGDDEWRPYEGPVLRRGKAPVTITARAADRVGNEGTSAPTEYGPRYVNYKPLLSLIFVLILLVVGIVVAKMRRVPLRRGLVAPSVFATAELALGLLSMAFDVLLFPPVLGAGLLVNAGVTAAGVAAALLWRRKEPAS